MEINPEEVIRDPGRLVGDPGGGCRGFIEIGLGDPAGGLGTEKEEWGMLVEACWTLERMGIGALKRG